MLINFIRKTSEEKLPGLGSKSPGLGPRIPGNGARSPATQGIRSPPHGAQSRASEYDEGNESKKNGKLFWKKIEGLDLYLAIERQFQKNSAS